jgi:hypothetical protein
MLVPTFLIFYVELQTIVKACNIEKQITYYYKLQNKAIR